MPLPRHNDIDTTITVRIHTSSYCPRYQPHFLCPHDCYTHGVCSPLLNFTNRRPLRVPAPVTSILPDYQSLAIPPARRISSGTASPRYCGHADTILVIYLSILTENQFSRYKKITAFVNNNDIQHFFCIRQPPSAIPSKETSKECAHPQRQAGVNGPSGSNNNNNNNNNNNSNSNNHSSSPDICTSSGTPSQTRLTNPNWDPWLTNSNHPIVKKLESSKMREAIQAMRYNGKGPLSCPGGKERCHPWHIKGVCSSSCKHLYDDVAITSSKQEQLWQWCQEAYA
eukprot:jgi/Psemu1/54376/gm1.54376_g